MSGSNDPFLVDQSSTTGYFLIEKLLLDYGHLPWVLAKLGILATHYFGVSGVINLTTLCEHKTKTIEHA